MENLTIFHSCALFFIKYSIFLDILNNIHYFASTISTESKINGICIYIATENANPISSKFMIVILNAKCVGTLVTYSRYLLNEKKSIPAKNVEKFYWYTNMILNKFDEIIGEIFDGSVHMVQCECDISPYSANNVFAHNRKLKMVH